MNFRKKDFIIYSIAIMLVAAGYFNYLNFDKKSIEVSTDITENEINEESKEENIGDAVLVNNSEIIENDSNEVEEEDEEKEEEIQTSNENIVNTNYYAESKLERNKMYAEMINKYNEIISNPNSSEVQKNIATNEITKINNTKNAIMICENIILTKDFEECVILANENSVNIVVHTEGGLNTEKVSQIQNIISRELGAEIEDIHIAEL